MAAPRGASHGAKPQPGAVKHAPARLQGPRSRYGFCPRFFLGGKDQPLRSPAGDAWRAVLLRSVLPSLAHAGNDDSILLGNDAAERGRGGRVRERRQRALVRPGRTRARRPGQHGSQRERALVGRAVQIDVHELTLHIGSGLYL